MISCLFESLARTTTERVTASQPSQRYLGRRIQETNAHLQKSYALCSAKSVPTTGQKQRNLRKNWSTFVKTRIQAHRDYDADVYILLRRKGQTLPIQLCSTTRQDQAEPPKPDLRNIDAISCC